MLRFHNIEPNNIENGIGIRTVFWVSGCFHSCKNCHNPITHDPTYGVEFNEDNMKEIIDSLAPEYIDGITFSGGDPLCYYPDEILQVIRNIKEVYGDTKTIWLYTGFNLERLCREIVDNLNPERAKSIDAILRSIDVICDGPYIETFASKDYNWVGSSNQRVIDMKKSIEKREIVFFDESQRQYYKSTVFKRDLETAFKEWSTHKV